jgi:hypothetical protein
MKTFVIFFSNATSPNRVLVKATEYQLRGTDKTGQLVFFDQQEEVASFFISQLVGVAELSHVVS